MKKYADLNSVVEFLDKYCAISGYSDFEGSYNGLQFENSGKVSRIAAAVDAGINEIKETEIILPNMSEQKKIGLILKNIDIQIKKNNNMVQKFKFFKPLLNFSRNGGIQYVC